MIFAYNGYTSNDFTRMGLGAIMPISCTVTEKAGGSYELEMTHPIDPEGRWEWLSTGNIIKCPCPVYDVGSTMMGTDADVWKTTTAAKLYSQPNAPTRITYSQWVISTDYPQGSKVTYKGQNYQSTQILMDYEIHIAPPDLPSKWSKIQNYTSGSSVVAELAANTEVYVISAYNASWNRVRAMSGEEGYLQTSASTYVRTETRQPVEPRTVMDQLFRIYKTEINTDRTQVKVSAQHVSYDLSGNLLGSCQISKLTPAGAVSRVRSTMLEDADCTIATNIPDTAEPFSADFSYKNPVYALLDPKEGIVPFYGAMLVRDNWDFFVLENEATDRGFEITYGVNLRGVTWKTDTQKVVTRIVPIAKKADDTDLLLPETNVDSTFIDSYPTPLAQTLKVDGKVGGDDGQGGTWTEADLLDYMRAQAQAQFDAGCDLPTEDIKVEFQLLGDTVEYAQYKKLEKLYLYDTVTVIHPDIGLNRKLQVSETQWDAIRESFEAITLSSSLDYTGITIAGFQISTGAITAKNMGRGSVGVDQIQNGAVIAGSIAAGAVTAGKIAANAVEADKIKAGAVNADKIAAGAVETAKLAAGAVTTAKLDAGAVTADKIDAGAVTAAKLAADVFTAVDAEISSANIDYAQIKDASVQNLITKDAIADRYYIEKLQVQNLQVLHQTVDNLVVKAANGNYYSLDISDAGVVTPTQVTVTTSEINAGVTSSGRSIIETDLLVTDLAASNIKGANALIDKITAARLDVGELFARQATINQLQTVDISSNTSLQVQAQNQIDLTVGELNISGVNLILGGDKEVSNTDYNVAEWAYFDELTPGETYTFTICLTPAPQASVPYYRLFLSAGLQPVTTRLDGSSGNIVPTGTAKQILKLPFRFSESGYSGTNHVMRLYRPENTAVSDATTVHWAKLEKGTQTSDAYTPPPNGSDNLLYDSGVEISASDSSTRYFGNWQSDDMITGETYTFTACIKPGSDHTSFTLNVPGTQLGGRVYYDTGTGKQVVSVTFVFAGYTQSGHYVFGYRAPATVTTAGTVYWAKLCKGVNREAWSPNPNEINNSGIKITNEGIDIYTDGKLNMSGGVEGQLLLPNGDVTAANGNFTNLNVAGAVAALGSTGAELTLYQSVTGWRLNESNGLCSSNSAYKLVKFAVTAGNTVTVVSDDRWQFQNNSSVPTSGTSNRVGSTTYGAGTFTMTVPSGATYIIISTPTGGKGYAYSQFTAAAFFMPVKCWFTRGASAKPSTERGYLWFNASTTTITSSTVSASTGGESVSADGRTMTSATITDILGSGTINYTLSFVLSNYKFAQTQTNTVSVVVSDGTNSLTFTSAATPMPQWNNVQFSLGQSSSTNLFAAKKALTMRFTISNPNGDSYSVCYFTGTPITLTGQSTAAAGEGTVTVKYIS